ncbi:MAG: ribosome biogenesis GTPase Der, partial [Pseudomonadota bacterium]|nr:ribosome biogenesis GTPase Der [Pseudomonadota bacterium]
MKPVIAIVGRANVGKSTLFNRLTKTRDAIVADVPGLTRDRHYGDARVGKRDFIIVDSGGFEPEQATGIVLEMAKQTKQAVAEADAVIFVTDLRVGVNGHDHEIARFLRSASKKVVLAVNKAEGLAQSPLVAEFHELGLGEPHPFSAAHGQGVGEVAAAALELADSGRPPELDAEPLDAEPDPNAPIRLAVAGRPNVGKSTLINAWLGEERLVAFDQPGTTRDAIVVPFERGGRRFELIDTAGLRRRGKVFEAVEKFSVVKTLQSVADANVVVLVLDARQEISD